MLHYSAFVKIKAAVKLSFSLNFVEKFYNYVVHSKIFAIFKLLGCEAATLFFYIWSLKKSIFYLVNVAGRGVEGPLKKLLRFSCEKTINQQILLIITHWLLKDHFYLKL